MIVDIQRSPLIMKRFRVFMDDGRHFDFGLKGGSTYLDHHNKQIRQNYWKRHYANPVEKDLIDNLVPSPSLFSAFLLWGSHTSLEKNIKELNDLWKFKHSKK